MQNNFASSAYIRLNYTVDLDPMLGKCASGESRTRKTSRPGCFCRVSDKSMVLRTIFKKKMTPRFSTLNLLRENDFFIHFADT